LTCSTAAFQLALFVLIALTSSVTRFAVWWTTMRTLTLSSGILLAFSAFHSVREWMNGLSAVFVRAAEGGGQASESRPSHSAARLFSIRLYSTRNSGAARAVKAV
jgi:hypothetical protein